MLRLSLVITVCFYLVLLSNVGAKAEETTTLLLFGDSLVAGYGVGPQESLPAQLEKILRQRGQAIRVINGGVSGDTTSGGRSRLAWMLKKHQPDRVVLALGGNDLLRGLQPTVTRDNIHAMLSILAEKNIPTTLSAVRAPSSAGAAFQQKFDAIYTDAAKQYNVPLIPFFLEYTYGNRALMQPDGIHPNASGVKVIAENLAKQLAL